MQGKYVNVTMTVSASDVQGRVSLLRSVNEKRIKRRDQQMKEND